MRFAIVFHACFAVGLFTAVAVHGQPRDSPTCQAQVLSATVLATSCSHAAGDHRALDLFIMWRGTPGWFQRRENGVKDQEVVRDFAHGEHGRVAQYRTFADVTIGFDADFATTGTVTIDNVAIPLANHNTILVDHVDVPHIRRLGTTFYVEPTLPLRGDTNLILARRSAGVREALQCNVPLPSPKASPGSPAMHQWHIATVCDLLR
jgi:hypothetical protein